LCFWAEKKKTQREGTLGLTRSRQLNNIRFEALRLPYRTFSGLSVEILWLS
jgi:hypothetical protein